MKKLLAFALSISVLFCSFALAGTVPLGKAQFTSVSGIINSDTTWTRTNSPYSLTGNILVSNGVTLTIEMGVTVNLGTYYIRVNGTLNVEALATLNIASSQGINIPPNPGEQAAIQVNGALNAKGIGGMPVYINGTRILHFPTVSTSSVIYFAQSSGESIIQNAVINATTLEVSSSVKISNSIVSDGAQIIILGGSPTISNNTLSSLSVFGDGSPTVTSNRFTGGIDYDSQTSRQTTITDNVISASLSGIVFESNSNGRILVMRNVIVNSDVGIRIFSRNDGRQYAEVTILNNTVANNTRGLVLAASTHPTVVAYNNIQNNNQYNIAADSNNNVNATYNWWGTNDPAAINASIYDFKNDFNLGTVNFTPYLTAPNPEAIPNTTIPLPTPSPTPNPSSTPTQTAISPTPTPTQTQNPNLTASASPSPTANQTPMPSLTSSASASRSPTATPTDLTVTYQAAIAVLAVLVVVLLVVIGFLFRKRKSPEPLKE